MLHMGTRRPARIFWADLTRFLARKGLGRHFWQQLTQRVLPALNRTLGVWEDDQPQPHPDDLPRGSFGNIWQAQSTLMSAVANKFKAVLSGPWYLDQQKPGGCSQYSLQGCPRRRRSHYHAPLYVFCGESLRGRRKYTGWCASDCTAGGRARHVGVLLRRRAARGPERGRRGVRGPGARPLTRRGTVLPG